MDTQVCIHYVRLSSLWQITAIPQSLPPSAEARIEPCGQVRFRGSATSRIVFIANQVPNGVQAVRCVVTTAPKSTIGERQMV